MNVNKAIIIGNITRDPELKALPTGQSICSFSIATNRSYKTKNGDKKTETEYHSIIVFGKTAENIAQYMRKGSQIMVEGRIQTRSWETDSGKRYKTEIVAESVQFGSTPRNSEKSETDRKYDEISDVDYPNDDEGENGDIPFYPHQMPKDIHSSTLDG